MKVNSCFSRFADRGLARTEDGEKDAMKELKGEIGFQEMVLHKRCAFNNKRVSGRRMTQGQPRKN